MRSEPQGVRAATGRRPARRAAARLLVLPLALLLSSACSSAGAPRSASADRVSPSVQSGAAAVHPSSGGPGASAESGSAAPGTVLPLDRVASLASCPGTGGVPLISTQFLAGGLMMTGCWADDPVRTTVVDLVRGTRAFTRSDPKGTKLIPVGNHVYVVSQTVTPAGALTGEETHFSVECLEARTGRSLWKSPVQDWLPAEQRSGLSPGLAEAAEGTDEADGHPHTVLVSLHGTTLFDADTGKELWHGEAAGIGVEYSPYGVRLQRPDVDPVLGMTVKGFSLITGRQLWSLDVPPLPNPQEYEDGPVRILYHGGDGIFAYDVRTGKVVAKGTVPKGLEDVVQGGSRILATTDGGKRLAFYSITDMTAPLWSIPAEVTRPAAVRPGLVAVNGPRGVVLLSPQDGSVRSEVRDTSLVFGSGAIGAVPAYGLGLLGNDKVVVLDTDLQSP
ncbi:PQQ-like beta-propeller repeat protein [Kitasatospora sp. DSM 101779]|uniref:PQQ-like beta-propeller repeat protein n=1 Tax=Kitasatospora sp. DSM 101779 TaxID=2853165 RepID=UPI0021DB4970|nr:PQQ-like beta-propeller repeat protein [Kitasatospora sp. DSM 101779]MCU7826712.1 PQQ-like beta-propeller repeat protein [Kitasatospora sp. DSM 101779]